MVESVLTWITENKEWLFSGLGVAVVGWGLKTLAGFFSASNPSQAEDRASASVPRAADRQGSGSRSVEFATGPRLEQHRRFFAATSVGTHPTEQAPAEGGPCVWRVVAEWDASHAVPRRGDGQRINPPEILSWSPKGDEIVTACDAFGLTRWTIAGRRIGGGTSPTAYGDTIRIFWSPDGALTLLEARTARNIWWSVHDRQGHLVRQVVSPVGLPWGWDGMEDYGFNRTRGFSPWRPGARDLLVSGADTRLELYDIRDFPRSSRESKTFADINPWASVDLGPLGALNRRVFKYAWHPSGEYLAVTTGDPDDYKARVHVLHWNSGEVVATLPMTTLGLDWSPGGRFLLCHRWNEPYTAQWKIGLVLWDALSWELRELDPKEVELAWVRRLDHHHRPAVESALSADGQRTLNRISGDAVEVSVGRSSDDSAAVVAGTGGVLFAEWAPRNPRRFATVGGKGATNALRIWEAQAP